MVHESYVPFDNRILYCRHNHETMGQGRPSILLIHGLGDSGLAFQEIFSREQFEGFNVVVPDLIGYGRSSRPDPDQYGFELHLDTLRQVVDCFDLEHVTLVGHSLGGDLGTLLCRENLSGRIERFLNVESNLTPGDLFISKKAAEAAEAGTFDDWFQWEFLYRQVYGDWCPRWPFGRRYLASLHFCDPKAFAKDASELYARNWKSDSEGTGTLYRGLPLPKLFVFGQKSLSHESRCFLHEYDLVAYEVRGSHHWPMIECPDEFYDVLYRWCRGEEVGGTLPPPDAAESPVKKHRVAQVRVPALAEYDDPAVRLTLDDSNAPRLIREARQKQDEILRQRYAGKPIRIADVGCGDGYHAEIFASDCLFYHGYEISKQMVERARQRCAGLANVEIIHGDALEVPLAADAYDVVWCLYFTPGNLRPGAEKVDTLADYEAHLDPNWQFVDVMARFFAVLAPGGSLLLTVYQDVPQAEQAQRAFYWRTGQIVLTDFGSRFVATDKGFWSMRWTQESMRRHLKEAKVPERNVTFADLNEIAWLVEARK